MQGTYIAITAPNTTNCPGVMNSASGTPAARICSIPRAISFLRMPTMNDITQTAGSPRSPTVMGDSGSTIGSRRLYVIRISMTIEPTISRGSAM